MSDPLEVELRRLLPDAAGHHPDLARWWRATGVLPRLGPALVALHADARPTAVLSPQPRGVLVGALVAAALDVALVEVHPGASGPGWATAAGFGVRTDLLGPADAVLLVDDWVGSGTAARAARQLVAAVGARWLGAAVVGDALGDDDLRVELGLRGLVRFS